MEYLTVKAIDRMAAVAYLKNYADALEDREKTRVRISQEEKNKNKNWVSIHENKKQATDRPARHCSPAYHLRKL